jgi:hypothetical protein
MRFFTSDKPWSAVNAGVASQLPRSAIAHGDRAPRKAFGSIAGHQRLFSKLYFVLLASFN